MNRCTRCYMPDTRPGSHFVNGVCGACRNYDKRKDIDWAARWDELKELCDQNRFEFLYDCLIPVSGGKDSYTLVKIMVEDMGMHPLLVTVSDSFTHTRAGTQNLRNLIERYNLNHWQYTISHDLFKRATRAAFEATGEALKFVEAAIYMIPFKLAQTMHIPLVVFGENSAYEYGSMEEDTGNANLAILNLNYKMGQESEWWKAEGLSTFEIESIRPNLRIPFMPRVLFMSYFTPWSSVTNLAIAQQHGFEMLNEVQPEWERQGTIEQFEQIDSVAYMVHLWLKYPKFGFQRALDIASRRCREGWMTLDEVKRVAVEIDPILDPLARFDFCDTLGYTRDQFWTIVENLWNRDLFEKKGNQWTLK